VNLDLIGVQAKLNPKSIGTLAVRLMKPREGAAFAIKEIQDSAAAPPGPGQSIAALGAAGGEVVKASGNLAQISPVGTAIASALESVTSKLDIVVKLGDQIATVCLRTPMVSSLFILSPDSPLRQYSMDRVNCRIQGKTGIGMTHSILSTVSGREKPAEHRSETAGAH
jgi:hypothetical protein